MNLITKTEHELIIPTPLAEERIRKDFAPLFRFCNSIAPAKDQREFSQDLADWLRELGPEEREKTCAVLFFNSGSTGIKRLTPNAMKIARSMLELFNLKREEKKKIIITESLT